MSRKSCDLAAEACELTVAWDTQFRWQNLSESNASRHLFEAGDSADGAFSISGSTIMCCGVPKWVKRMKVYLLWQKNAIAKDGSIRQRRSHVAIYRRHRTPATATTTSFVSSSPVGLRGEFWSEEMFLIISSRYKIKILPLIQSCTNLEMDSMIKVF